MRQEPSSRRGRSLSDRMTCAARAVWYSTEKHRLKRYRRTWRDRLNPKVSVYIPTHNRRELLVKRALASVRWQTYENLEIIVAAHGCTDNTVPWIRGLRVIDPRLRLLIVPRTETYPPTAENHWLAGPVVPANAALSQVTGDWIARIDDDDIWAEDHIEKLLRFAQDGDYEFVSSAYERTKNKKREIVHHDGEFPPIGGTQTWLYRFYLKFMRYNPDCWRKSWNRVNDTDLADRFRKAGVRIGHLDEVTCFIEPRPGETTVGLEAYLKDAAKKEQEFAF